jgi:hypothetical protein
MPAVSTAPLVDLDSVDGETEQSFETSHSLTTTPLPTTTDEPIWISSTEAPTHDPSHESMTSESKPTSEAVPVDTIGAAAELDDPQSVGEDARPADQCVQKMLWRASASGRFFPNAQGRSPEDLTKTVALRTSTHLVKQKTVA